MFLYESGVCHCVGTISMRITLWLVVTISGISVWVRHDSGTGLLQAFEGRKNVSRSKHRRKSRDCWSRNVWQRAVSRNVANSSQREETLLASVWNCTRGMRETSPRYFDGQFARSLQPAGVKKHANKWNARFREISAECVLTSDSRNSPNLRYAAKPGFFNDQSNRNLPRGSRTVLVLLLLNHVCRKLTSK